MGIIEHGVVDVPDLDCACASSPTDGSALVNGGKKGIPVVSWSAFSCGRGDCYESGKVFVFRAQTVRNPTAHGRTDKVGSARMQKKGGRTMSHAFRMHGMNKCEVIHLTGYMGEKRGDGLPAFAVLLEIPQGFHQFPLALFAKGCGTDTYEINVLAILGDQFGLVVESIDVTGSTRHEDENYALSSLRDEGGLGGQGIAREKLGRLACRPRPTNRNRMPRP